MLSVLFYRFLLTLAAPFVLLRLWRAGMQDLPDRLGAGGQGIPAGAVIWLHAASNGELTAAQPLIEALLARDPRLRLVVTCNSATGKALAEGWGLPRLHARLAPLDYALAVRRFIGNWQPDALIVIENELWPNRIAAMHRLDRPVIVLSGRMSARSARVWRRLPGLARRVMAGLSHVAPQDSASGARFPALGLAEPALGPVLNLKQLGSADPADAGDIACLSQIFDRDKTVLAASTHEGEESVLLRGFADALHDQPDLRLILAPRHARRGPEVAQLISRARLGYATRSRGEVPGPDQPVYLADTMGEMGLWYGLAGLTFVGGSLMPKGGHTPFEPAAHDSALLHGPHLENFAEIYAALEAAGATRRIAGAEEFATAILTLTPEDRAAMTAAARSAIATLQRGAGLGPVIDRIATLTGNTALHHR